MKGKVKVEIVGPPTHQGRLARGLRRRGHKTLPPSCLRCLVAILELAQEGVTITRRKIARKLGLAPSQLTSGASYHVTTVLNRLRDAGLVSFEAFKASTIVPLVRLEMRNPEYETAIAQWDREHSRDNLVQPIKSTRRKKS